MSGAVLLGRVAIVFLIALLAAGCGGGDDGQTTTTATDTETTTSAGTRALRVYFLRAGKVWPARRDVDETEAVATAALEELKKGPTETEADVGFTSAVSADFQGVTISNGAAEVDGLIALSDEGLAQIVYTLTQFPTVRSVEIGDRR